MKKKFSIILAIVVLTTTAFLLFTGCLFGGSKSGGSSSGGGGSIVDKILPEVSTIKGEDVFDGERFNEMVWGYYEEEFFDYNGSFDDSAQFREGMKYKTVTTEYGDKTFSVLPLDIQFGKYTHFMSSFSYDDDFYDAYTEKGRAMFRKAYMEQFGDLTEEDFAKIEKIMQLDVVQLTFCQDFGATNQGMGAYEIKGNKILIYDLAIDEAYNYTISDKPMFEYEFLHDGGKLTLACQGVQRSYLTSGYKETDSGFYISGYARNAEGRYQDLEGFSLYQFDGENPIETSVHLSTGDIPIDAMLDLDKATGKFTLSWEEVFHYEGRNLLQVAAPRTISGIMIPCTSYGFTSYEGMFLFIDGTRYDYLMSQEEYDERKEDGMIGAGDLNDSDRTALETAKRSILEELDEAFQAAGIKATVNYDTGKVDLEANFLFDTNSYELSADGKAYLDKFVDIYTSVVLRDEYAGIINSVVVEGHTDTKGSYSYNQTLSQNRADAVASHCAARNGRMGSIVEAQGCSYDYPVYNNDGSVNMEASRRVTFRFVLTAN